MRRPALLALAAVFLMGIRTVRPLTGLSPELVNGVKAAVAVAGTLLLLAGCLPGLRRGRAGRLWDAALVLLATLAAACWWNLFQFHYPGFGHLSETYHYFLGAKYTRELGYTRLYQCTAVADSEAGRTAQVAARTIRDLSNNSMVSGATLLADADACKRHFTPERWLDFRRDVRYFRARASLRHWEQLETDHGYNATPAWGLFGTPLANTGLATPRHILALRLLDPLLLVAAGAAVAAAFGWRVLCVALLYWGTNYPAGYDWVGGSYLRQLELAAALGGIALLRRGRAGPGGALLSLATLVRVYPGALLAGPALQALGRTLRERRVAWRSPQVRALLGALAAAAVLVPLSSWVAGSVRAWPEFVAHSRVLMGTPLRNHMGLRTLLSWAPGERARAGESGAALDPWARWKESRERTFARRRPLFAVLVLAYALLLVRALRGQPVWVAAVLGAGLVPVAAELTCYYQAILVVFALLWERHPPVGVALCALSALGWWIADHFPFYDEIFPWISLASVAFVVFATAWVWRASTAGDYDGARATGA